MSIIGHTQPGAKYLPILFETTDLNVSGPLNITLHHLSRTFHPILRISISPTTSSPKAGSSGCYALLSLKIPDEAFIDKDELGDRWGIQPSIVGPARYDHFDHIPEVIQDHSRTGIKAWTINPMEIDIERPVRTIRVPMRGRNGEEIDAASILSLALELKDEITELEIPLHGRYLIPDTKGGEREIIVFGEGGGEIRGGWMCAMSEDPNQIFAYPPPPVPSSSSDPVSDSPRSTCITVTSKQPAFPIIRSIDGKAITLTLPIGNSNHQIPVEIITAVAIWLGWFYLVWKIWGLCRRGNRGVVTEIKKRN